MRAVVQRVLEARVEVGGEVVGAIDRGLCVLVAAGKDDGDKDLTYVADKIAGLRIFGDDEGKMNRSVVDIGGGVLAISQFTLYGDVRRGRRPSFIDAMPPEEAEASYDRFVEVLGERVPKVATGRFRAQMDVHIVNHGPVTILIDSTKAF